MKFLCITVVGAIGGFLGGLAEVLYTALVAPTYYVEVLEQITYTFTSTPFLHAAYVGLVLHQVAAVLIGVGLAYLLIYTHPRRHYIASATLLLAIIWAINFFIIGPAFAPAFVALVPAGIALFSKLSFGAILGYTIKKFT